MKGWEGLTSKDAAEVRETITRAVSSLASGDVEDVIGLGMLLVELVAHDDMEVRSSLAAACEFLPEHMASPTLAVLAKDRAAFVRNNAERTLTRRASAKKRRAKAAERPETIEALLKQIGAKQSKPRRHAERAVRLAEEAVSSALYHELSKIRGALNTSFVSILSETGKARPDLGAIARHVEDAKRRIDLEWSIVKSVREYVSTVTPVFREERVAAIVEEARRSFVAGSEENAGRLVFTADIPERLKCECERHRLLQVFANLFQNAKEAYGESGPFEIRVEARATDGGRGVEISVADQGCGMSAEQLAEAFEPYRTSKPGGMGVGLPLVRRVVEEIHGGSVAIESTVGEGTKVGMMFPAKQG